MASRTAYSTWTPQKSRLFDGHYLHNRSTLDIGVLGYIGVVQHKEHSPEVLSIPSGTLCVYTHEELNSIITDVSKEVAHDAVQEVLTIGALKMAGESLSETSVTECTRRHTPGDCNFRQLRRENLRSCMVSINRYDV